MVSIEQVNFFNHEYLPKRTIFHSGPSLVIHQHQESKKEETKLSFFLKKSDETKLKLFDEDVGMLEILLNLTLGYRRRNDFLIPLKATEEMQQMTQLLFTYYFHDKLNYSVDRVLDFLVHRTLKVNSKILNGDRAFLSLIDFMEENLDQPLQVIDFCSLLHVSESNLNRLCKEQAGVTAMKLFRKIQCYEADRLMRETNFTIQEISQKLGFKSISQFSAMYRRTEGISPLKKRKLLGGISDDKS